MAIVGTSANKIRRRALANDVSHPISSKTRSLPWFSNTVISNDFLKKLVNQSDSQSVSQKQVQ
jgi:hypothetical protein